MKKKIVFLLQNGIGFGHFKLALTIAKNFDSEKFEIIFLTQAKSTRIFDGYNYKVINIPPTYSLRSNNEVLFVHKFVDKVIDKIKPSVVIEDTYPDDFYLNLPKLQFIPKILIINRLIAVEFENYYYNGVLEQYDKIIIIKNQHEFLNELTSVKVKNFARYSDKIIYNGNVFNEPSPLCCENVKNKYEFRKYKKNIVVNCGAGGWHIGENVCKIIFKKIIEIGNIICKMNEAQIIILLGPYSSYIIPKLEKLVHKGINIKMIDFEDNSDALFHEADLVILRPGYNSTMEALSGNAEVILLPGISYLESQDEWCMKLKNVYGIEYVSVNNLESLAECIKDVLNNPRRKNEKVINYSEKVMQIISEFINETESVVCHNPLIAIRSSIFDDESFQLKTNEIFQCELTIYKDGYLRYKGIQVPVINNGMQYADFKDLEIVAVIQDEKYTYTPVDFYESRYSLSNKGVIVLPITLITIGDDFSFDTEKFRYLLRKSIFYRGCICFDISENLLFERKLDVVKAIFSFILSNNIKVSNLKSWLAESVEIAHEEYRYHHYRPEITKLS